MGVKVEKALYKSIEITPLEYDKEKMKNNLQCPYCKIELCHVTSHIRKYGDIDKLIKAYFKIKNNDHSIGCRYNTVGAIKIVADVAEKELLNRNEDGTYYLRLHLISEKINNYSSIINGTFALDDQDENKKAKKIYEAKQKIDSYLSTMREIIKIRDNVDANSEISRHLKLSFYNNHSGSYDTIPWHKFYFDYDRYLSAYKHLRTSVVHPMCFEGVVKDITNPNDKFKKYKIKFEYSKKADYKGNDSIVSVDFIIQNDKLMDSLKESIGKRILIYSKCWAKEPYKGKDIYFLNILGSLYHKNQIYIEK